jgi:dolichol-phosphate mannosyltransferase
MSTKVISTLPPLARPGRLAAFRFGTWDWQRTFLALLAIAILLRIVAMCTVPLIPEEAYYWMYSQHPSLSYFDHPPMVSWVIGLGSYVFGNNEFGVRIVGMLLMFATSWLMFLYGRMWFGRTVGVVVAIAIHALPIYFCAGMIAPMESALLFFWAACLLSISHVLKHGRNWCWYPAGVALGCAMLSKYTGIFLGVSAFLALVIHRPWRRQFLSPHPYLAALVTVAVFSPVLIWNWQHDWASFRFQFIDRFENEDIKFNRAAEFIGFQFAVLTPLLIVESARFIGRTVRSRRRLLNPKWLIALCFSLPLLAVMAQKSLRFQIHINWTLPAYLALIPAVTQLILIRLRALRRSNRKEFFRQYIRNTAILCAVICVGIAVYLVAVQPHTRWISAFGPWRELAAIVEEHEDALEAQTGREPLIIASGKYRMASVMAFYRMPLEGDVAASRRTTSQWRVALGQGLAFPYWADVEAWRGADCIVVIEETRERTFEVLRTQFDSVEEINDPRVKKLDKDFSLAIGRGLRESPTTLPARR